MIEPYGAFDAAFDARAPAGLGVRPQRDVDEPFLRELFLATFALRDVLPAPLVAQQADLQLAAFRHSFPGAMRRIVEGPAGPVGRIIVDWDEAGASRCVDIAVYPAHGGRGIGTALLQAWIQVAAARGLACTLNVAPDNPARRLYARLGFRDAPGEPGSPAISMVLPHLIG